MVKSIPTDRARGCERCHGALGAVGDVQMTPVKVMVPLPGRRRRMIGSQLKGGGRTGRRDVVEGDQRRGYLTGTHTNETGRGWHSRSVIRNMQARR